LARDHKEAFRAYLEGLAERAGLQGASDLSHELMLLIDGATVLALIHGTGEPAWHARRAAEALVRRARSS
jgi:hypothetical protein